MWGKICHFALVFASLTLFGMPLHAATLTAVNETPTLDGVDNGDWTGDAIVTLNNVTMKAAYDDNNFYLLTQWDDPTSTENVFKKLWTFDGSAWSQSGNEDRIAIMWDIGATPEGASCATMCHPPHMYTSEGTVDVWHWKAHRSNPMGYADDKYFIAIQDTTPGGETRLGDGGNNTYDDNVNGNPNPLSQAQADPNANVDFLTRDQATFDVFDPFGVMTAHTVDIAVDWVDAGWTAGSTVAGYVLEIPDGSRADVRTAGHYDNGTWTVEFMRPLTTTGPDDDTRDVQFDPVNSYDFAVAIFDNAGDENHLTDPIPHTLEFGPVGIGDDGESPGVPRALALSQNYPNPFNPSTSIRYTVPEEISRGSTVSLEIFNVHGQRVRTLVRRAQTPGEYTVHWNGTDDRGLRLPSGLYVYRLTAGETSIVRKMALLK